MAAQTIPVPQEATIASVVAAVQAPKGVRLKRIYFNLDHAGEPAIRVVFGVSTKIELTKARVRELGVFRRSVRDAISALAFDAFPYVTFEDAR